MAQRKEKDDQSLDNDPHFGALKHKLEGYEEQLGDLERDRNKLVEKHDAPGKVDQMRRDIDNDISDVKEKIADTRTEILEYQINKDAERDKQMLEGMHDLNKEGAEHLYGKEHGEGHDGRGELHGQPEVHHPHVDSNSSISGSAEFGPKPDWSFSENVSTHATAQPDSALLEQQQNAIQSHMPHAPHGAVGDFYTPGSHDGPVPPPPPDLAGTTASVGIDHGQVAHADHGVASPSPVEAWAMGLTVVGAAGYNKVFGKRAEGAGQEQGQTKPDQPQADAPPIPPAPGTEMSGSPQGVSQQTTPQQAAPAIPPTPDSQPVSETAQPSPAPAAQEPER